MTKTTFSKNNNIVDNVKEFQTQYSIAKIIAFKYLKLWFKQIFDLPDWREKFLDKPHMSTEMSAEVLRYLFGDEDNRNSDILEQKDETEMAKRHAEKWADDCLSRDADFRNLVIQTIRLDAIYHQYIEGVDWYKNNPKGIRISRLLEKYGGSVEESTDPERYIILINRWKIWDNLNNE